jgi:hypothetical protein
MADVTFREANRRYLRVFVPTMVFYSVACFVGPALLRSLDDPPKSASALVAVGTAAPMALVFWLIARLLRETDEYTRKMQSDEMLIGGAITLSAAMLWGFLELYGVMPQAPRLPATMMVAPAFFASFGLVHAVRALRRS